MSEATDSPNGPPPVRSGRGGLSGHRIHRLVVLGCTLAALAALALLGVRSFTRLETWWDAWYYHVPFAADYGGLGVPYTTLDRDITTVREGFPPLPFIAHGLLWRLTGSLNAVGVRNFIAFATFLYFATRVLRARLSLVALVALTSPLVVIHAASTYYDLFANSFMAIGATGIVGLFLFDRQRERKLLLWVLFGLVGAAWSKIILIPLVGIALASLFVYYARTRPAPQDRAWVWIAACAVVCAIPYVRNLLLFHNPIWPCHIPFLPRVPYAMDVTERETPPLLVGARHYEIFFRSLFEIGQPLSYPSRARYVVDQGRAFAGFRSGGFWGIGVLAYLTVLVGLATLYSRRRAAWLGLGVAGTLVVVAVIPDAHNLRYVMFLPLSWAAIIGMFEVRLSTRFPWLMSAASRPSPRDGDPDEASSTVQSILRNTPPRLTDGIRRGGPPPPAPCPSPPSPTELPRVMSSPSLSPSPKHPWLPRLRVSGGYLDGLDVPFTPGGNVICGAPGSGKSTALALLRYVLGLRVPEKRCAEFDSLIATNLGAGRAYVTLASAYGAEHEISRAGAENMARVESSGGAAASLSAVLEMCPVRFAGHGELELLATDGLARLDLLTSFARDEVDRVGADLAKVRRQLDESAPALFRLKREIDALAGKRASLPAERARLAELKKAAGGDPVDLDQANRLKALREREKMMLEAAEREVQWLRGEADVFAATARRRLGQVVDAEAERGPNAELVAEAARALARIGGDLETAAARTAEQCAAAAALFAKNGRALAERHAPADDAYRALLAAHESDTGRAFERLKLEKTVSELERASDEHAARVRERAQVSAQRDVLRARARALVAELLAVLDATAKWVTAALEDRVRVTVSPEADRTAYEALLIDLVKKKRFEKEQLKIVAASISPEDLCDQVLRGDISVLADKLESKAVAMRLVAALIESPRVYELETVDVPHIPTVSLMHGDEPKPSETLSSGQRKLAFFSLLLLDRRGVLIVDQPEDDVSNKYLAEDLCKMFAEVQDEMQFIFVTHDGNIPILGRAQRLIELDSDGKRGWVATEGAPSMVREPMENNFEGGRSAFVARKDFYGVR